jgi:outer membrane protein assembly factor BamB
MNNLKIALLAALFLISSIASGCMNGQQDNETSMFRGNALHTGSYATTGPIKMKGIKWTFEAKDKIRSSPVLYNDVVYVGSHDQNLYAIDAESGLEKWRFETKGPIISTPAVNSENVYIYSGDGYLYAVNINDGGLQWSYQTAGEDPPRDGVDYWQSSPTLSDGIIYFGGGESTFYAVNASSGSLEWKKKLPFNGYECDDCGPILHSTPAVSNGVVYAGIAGYDVVKRAEPGYIIALDAKTGDEIWFSGQLNAVDSAIVADKSALYFGMRNRGLGALDIKTGNQLNFSAGLNYLIATPALHEGILYSGSSDQQLLISVDTQTGKQLWKFKTAGPVHASPATDGNTVYAASGNHYTDENKGIIYAVDAKTGLEKWQYQTGGNIYSSPAIDNGVLFIGSDDGSLYAIE